MPAVGAPATEEVTALRAKVAQLEASLKAGAKAPDPTPQLPAAPAPPAATPMPGMGGSTPAAMAPAAGAMADMGMMAMMDKMMPMMEKMMPMMEKMMAMGGAPMPAGGGAMPAKPPAAGMDKMSGGMMGMMPMPMPADPAMAPATSSALPGFPGASHLYHVGATGFFLDHPQHITLTAEQGVALNKLKDQALLAKSAADRAVQQAEQELGTLTGADQPDGAKIEAKVNEITKLNGDARLAFIRAVGEAAKLLTADQRKSLTGFAPPAPAPGAMAMPAAAATTPAPMAPGMKDM